jgi:mono/diheme cytochrome c family protein
VQPPALDGSALYDANCSGCHGQANKGKNVPSSHLSGRVNLTPEELNAINAL